MRSRARLAALATALAVGGVLGAFAASGLGGGSGPATLGSDRQMIGPVPLERAGAGSGIATARSAGNGKTKRPKLTHLITTNPITVGADDELIAVLRCPKKQVPVTGGAIPPPPPANVLISVLSRFNPSTGAAPARKFYVGVRNEEAEAQEWFATLVCAKRVTEG